MMKTILVNETKTPLNARRLNKVVKHVRDALLRKKIRQKKFLAKQSEISFVFLTAKTMQKINLQFRGKDKPTDVLSFQSDDPNSLGELLFCLDVLKKQAREQKHSLDRELLYMVIHGFLHLLGYDHEMSKAEEKSMFRIQEEIFHELAMLEKVI